MAYFVADTFKGSGATIQGSTPPYAAATLGNWASTYSTGFTRQSNGGQYISGAGGTWAVLQAIATTPAATSTGLTIFEVGGYGPIGGATPSLWTQYPTGVHLYDGSFFAVSLSGAGVLTLEAAYLAGTVTASYTSGISRPTSLESVIRIELSNSSPTVSVYLDGVLRITDNTHTLGSGGDPRLNAASVGWVVANTGVNALPLSTTFSPLLDYVNVQTAVAASGPLGKPPVPPFAQVLLPGMTETGGQFVHVSGNLILPNMYLPAQPVPSFWTRRKRAYELV